MEQERQNMFDKAQDTFNFKVIDDALFNQLEIVQRIDNDEVKSVALQVLLAINDVFEEELKRASGDDNNDEDEVQVISEFPLASPDYNPDAISESETQVVIEDELPL